MVKKLWALVRCQFSFSRFGFFSAANGIITFVGDLLQPIAQAVTVLLACAVVLLIASVAWSHRLLKPYAESDVKNPLPIPQLEWAGDVTLFLGTACLFLLTTFLAQAVVAPARAASNARGEGVYATLIPALKGIQKSLDSLKRETSEDPRKELANLGVTWSGDNFLTAVKEGDERLVRLFVAGGIRVETAESQGRPLPVMLALNQADAPAMLDLLIAGGLDVNQAFGIAGTFGKQQTTLLGRAIEEGNAALVQALITRHVDVNRAIVTFGQMGFPKNTYPLPSAIYWKQYAIADMLVAAGADTSVGDYAGYRDVLEALRQPSEASQQATLRRLRDRIAPSGIAKDTADARQRLAQVERELNQVALASLRTMRQSSEKRQYDRRYAELQAERQKLRTQLGVSGNPGR